MRIPLLVASLVLLCATNAAFESDLPVYIRGLGWRNVEAELRKDLRLSPFVRPIAYDIYMNVSVRGYDNAEKSSFEGKIKISLNITAPVNEIELHSLGLDIKKATLIVRNSKGEELGDVNNNYFSINYQREALVVPSKIVIQPGASAVLTIEYSGSATMDGRGFYESWNVRENSSELPYISLVTQGEPAKARLWLPCFDEPDKKAIFRLRIDHPKKTKAYSNTRIVLTSTKNGRSETLFEPTVPLPTYLLALALTEQPVEELTVDGYEFRAIGYNRQQAVRSASDGLKILHNHSIFDGVPFFPKKTDILVVEEFGGAMENPGLITFGMKSANNTETHVHELAHMYFGNLVTLASWDDIWSSRLSDRRISLHDFAIHFDRTFTSSIYIGNSFGAQVNIHYSRASQVLRMIRNFIGGDVFDRAIKKYLLDNAYGNGNADKVIESLLNEYDGDRAQFKTMLVEWIYQPGVAVLFMERNESGVQLSQTRFHSSYFNEELRDNHTRFTIPLFCEVDGEPRTIVFDSHVDILTIPLPANSTFTIEDDYGELFGVWAQPEEEPENLHSWLLLSWNLVRSEVISHKQFTNAITPFTANTTVQEFLRSRIPNQPSQAYADSWNRHSECQSRGILDAPLTEVFPFYLRENSLDLIFCSNETTDRQLTKSLLHDKIVNDELKIRSNQLGTFIQKIELYHPGITMEFVYEELERDPSSLPLRLKMYAIINTAADVSEIHKFIRAHPSIVAESYDTVVKMLEDQYLKEEYAKRNDALVEMIKEILNGVPATDPTDEVANSITADIPKKIKRHAFRRF